MSADAARNVCMIEPYPASCPYCGEEVELQIDETAGEVQEFVEDCPVCCQPWEVRIAQDSDGDWSVGLRTNDE